MQILVVKIYTNTHTHAQTHTNKSHIGTTYLFYDNDGLESPTLCVCVYTRVIGVEKGLPATFQGYHGVWWPGKMFVKGSHLHVACWKCNQDQMESSDQRTFYEQIKGSRWTLSNKGQQINKFSQLLKRHGYFVCPLNHCKCDQRPVII